MACVDVATTSSPNMGSLKEDLTCVICCDLFREPVMLACMHHFCKSCISRYWRTATQGPATCPQCRMVFTTRQFHTNYIVTAMVEKIRTTTSETYIKNLEKQLREDLKNHLLRKQDFSNTIRRNKDKMEAIKTVAEDLQAHISGEFQALHQMLQDEESRMLEQLRREQEDELEKIRLHTEAIQSAVAELEENIADLEQFRTAAQTSALVELPQLRKWTQVVDPAEFDPNSLNIKYTAPIQYIAWRKMFKSLKPGPAPLTFDADTAHPNIFISKDKKLAVDCEETILHKDDCKRFSQCVNVLAAQGFQSGRHYWEVEVGRKHKWDVGVASESVERKTRTTLSPEAGYWTLRLRNRNEFSAGTQPWTRLQLASSSSSPRRIGVLLDFDRRRVSFYNADNMSLLYCFTNGPREKVFPFFSPCISADGEKPQPITLLHFRPAALSV